MLDSSKIHEVVMSSVNDTTSLMPSRHYALYFFSKEDREIYVYDARDPLRGVRDILNKHPEFEFLRVQSLPDTRTVHDICKKFREVREVRKVLLKEVESK